MKLVSMCCINDLTNAISLRVFSKMILKNEKRETTKRKGEGIERWRGGGGCRKGKGKGLKDGEEGG